MRFLGRSRQPDRSRQRGQSVVEFAIILPIILTVTMSVAEFGFAFGTNMTMIEATREGARVGAVLVNGAKSLGCPGYPGAANVDPQIIAAVQRVLESPGSGGISQSSIVSIKIYSYANPTTNFNEWHYTSSPSASVCGVNLDFFEFAHHWDAASRTNALPPDSIGVSIQYTYHLFTPLSALTHLFGLSQITMMDSTVMALEP